MKYFIKIFFATCSVLVFAFTFSQANDCKEAKEIIDRVLAEKPDAMTQEYIQLALDQCPDNSQLYQSIGDYYKTWYTKEINADKQAEYKRLAEQYLSTNINIVKEQNVSDKLVVSLEKDLAKLTESQEFNKAALRALRPVKSDYAAKITESVRDKHKGLHMRVNFQKNSFNLSNKAQNHLDILGEYLNENISTYVSLEGHTDKSGPDDWNMELSNKRAESAKAYLVQRYKISPERISTNGYGYSRLFDTKNPFNPKNRRVEVIKLRE